jgi:hypothetical protein
MRLLYTSDWHLGRTFYRESLIDAQRAFLDYLLIVVQEREVDAVLVAGTPFFPADSLASSCPQDGNARARTSSSTPHRPARSCPPAAFSSTSASARALPLSWPGG